MAVKQRTDLSRGLDALTDPGRVILARRRVPRKRRKTRRNLAAVRGELAVCYSLGCFRSIRGMLDKEPEQFTLNPLQQMPGLYTTPILAGGFAQTLITVTQKFTRGQNRAGRDAAALRLGTPQNSQQNRRCGYANTSSLARQRELRPNWSVVNKNTAALFYHRLREIVAARIEDESPLQGEIEIDESYFGRPHAKAKGAVALPAKSRSSASSSGAAASTPRSCQTPLGLPDGRS